MQESALSKRPAPATLAEHGARQPGGRKTMVLIRHLASLRLTAFLMALFGTGVFVAHMAGFRFAPVVAACMAALAVNLLCAIGTNPVFRRQWPLFIFHVALLVVIVLVALGRMVYLKGQAEVLEGEAFGGQLVSTDAGPWHPPGLGDVRFVNHGFEIAYAPGLKRQETRNKVSWQDDAGNLQEAVIGDDKPLVIDGYRFYTSWNKGFSLLFEWRARGEAPVIGAVNLPGYPLNALQQAQEWGLPGLAEPLWAMLQFDEDLIPEDRAGQFRLPDDYQVVVRHGAQRWVLEPEANTLVELPGGTLRFVGLRTWMGYHVTWDATVPWLLLASTVAVLALGWHFWRRYARQPWNP